MAVVVTCVLHKEHDSPNLSGEGLWLQLSLFDHNAYQGLWLMCKQLLVLVLVLVLV